MDAGGEHFVLVHGAGHGAWCWSKLVPLLQGSGHRVTCVDLAGAGSSPVDPSSVRSFDDYTAPLVDFLSARPDGEKVILVGHSAGGLSLTHAMHLFSDRIKLAIFITATMLPLGYRTPQDIKDGVPDFPGDVYEVRPTSVALRRECQRDILSQESPPEDYYAFASTRLRPWPAALTEARFGGDDSSAIDQVPRVYIKTTKDRMLKPEQQQAMIRRWPPNKVVAMDTGHSPFFSQPERLFQIIVESL